MISVAWLLIRLTLVLEEWFLIGRGLKSATIWPHDLWRLKEVSG